MLAAGDIGQCSGEGPFLTGKLLDRLKGEILAVGDIAYERGTDAEFRDCFDRAWGRHKARIHPVPGNHEYASPNAAPYYRYFGAAAAPGRGYYSFDAGSWHIVALNSSIDVAANSPQERWLRADLAKASGRCILAFFHHSWLSSGLHGRTDKLAPLVDDLYRAGTTLVVTGHDHHYERFTPVDSAGNPDPVHGIRFFVAGMGGAKPYPAPFRGQISEAASAGIWGVLGLTLRDGGYDWQFIAAQPTAFADSGSGRCVSPR